MTDETTAVAPSQNFVDWCIGWGALAAIGLSALGDVLVTPTWAPEAAVALGAVLVMSRAVWLEVREWRRVSA